MLGRRSRRSRRYEGRYYRRRSPFRKVLFFIIALLVILIFVRAKGLKEIDDVSPNIPCEQVYMEKANILWIIPEYNGTSISQNKEWCQKIIAMNKTLGLHGINHSYKEFNNTITEEGMNKAVMDFQKCFNQTPTMFKPPQLEISKDNLALIKEHNMTYKGQFNQITHKVYHCNNTGKLPNWFHNIF